MLDQFLDNHPWIAYFVGALAVLLAAEFGRRIGEVRRRREPDAMSGGVSAIQAAALGLFPLMMGLTFSMAISRLDLL